MPIRKLLTIEPSSAFIDIQDGTVVEIQGRLYFIISRDPWVVTACRYYWFDRLLGRLFEWRNKKSEDKDESQSQS